MVLMNKDIGLLFEYARSKFTTTDNKIADYFLARRPVKTIEELATDIGVSTASITRFCQKIGLNNLKEFLFLYQEQLDSANPLSKPENDGLHQDYFDVLQQLKHCLDTDVIDQITHAIARHQIIHVFGTGFSALAGADFKFRFGRLGKFVEVVQDTNSMQMYQDILTTDNLVIVLSLNAQNDDMAKVVKNLTRRGIETYLISANPKSKMSQSATATLLTASLHGEERTGMISAQLPMLMAIDHLYYHYVSLDRKTIKNWVSTEAPFGK
ncbi:MurR/RpiR family transcriptional regulator [Enterovibrio sp. ZSDZ42]|uniref:MurR/RpiR family transcriptional regulator n=1 Tax=Enterovibrio gelatinilyticus TaxID=2899819 RepID=A0ABT5QX16_9GAMM|nr:MurR/RpiR family transcriptional regulator [Enterovibrio sp. ZSDZ42]MDD1792560.1 MurR/RpiR family transcriptional regulator [Enterovibrio sp. ZSDZ42]